MATGKEVMTLNIPRSSIPLANLFCVLSPTCADSLMAMANEAECITTPYTDVLTRWHDELRFRVASITQFGVSRQCFIGVNSITGTQVCLTRFHYQLQQRACGRQTFCAFIPPRTQEKLEEILSNLLPKDGDSLLRMRSVGKLGPVHTPIYFTAHFGANDGTETLS